MSAVRIPDLTDLSSKTQLRALTDTLRQIRNEQARGALPVASPRSREDAEEGDMRADEGRFRVVPQSRGPADVGFDGGEVNELHFFVGGKWKRVMLEEL